MRLRPASWISWQVLLLLGAAFLLGGASAGALVTVVYLREAEPLTKDLYRQQARAQLLEYILQQQLPDAVVSFEDSPVRSSGKGATPSGHASIPTLPASRPAKNASAAARPTRQSAVAQSKPESIIETAPARPGPLASAAPTQSASATGSPPLPAAVDTVTGEELVVALRQRIDGVAAEKLGVTSLESSGVMLRNGSRVRPGQYFPSGEKLLQIDADNSRIVTNQRQLLLFFSQKK